MDRNVLKSKSEVARSLADATLRRAAQHEAWGCSEMAARLLERAVAYEADAERYEAQAREGLTR
jgi:hypothetical protein